MLSRSPAAGSVTSFSRAGADRVQYIKGDNMTAIVFPFPIIRRDGFVQKQANHAACMNPAAGARYIEYQIQVQGDAMRRRGIAEDLIARELTLMDAAIRRELHASVSTGDA